MNTTDLEGGSARCAHRLHIGLQKSGIDSTYVVQKKFSDSPTIVSTNSFPGRLFSDIRPAIDRIPLRLYPNRKKSPFSTGLISPINVSQINAYDADIVNLHYVGEGYLPIRSLSRLCKPIVWTLHDSQPFTGGCHLPGECRAYENLCGFCPLLGSETSLDISRLILLYKKHKWRDANIIAVADSTWLAECARKSSLFKSRRIEVINPGLSLSSYKPVDAEVARSILGLPRQKKLILFGAMNSTSDPNKGFQYLVPAIKHLATLPLAQEAEVVIFGSSKPSRPQDLGIPIHYLGRLHDDISLSVVYSSADVMVVPSIRESFGQTASESLACGTPVVAFAATGLLDIVNHMHNGYLAKPYDHLDLANGIAWVISREVHVANALSVNARNSAATRFSQERMTESYINLFEDILIQDQFVRP